MQAEKTCGHTEFFSAHASVPGIVSPIHFSFKVAPRLEMTTVLMHSVESVVVLSPGLFLLNDVESFLSFSLLSSQMLEVKSTIEKDLRWRAFPSTETLLLWVDWNFHDPS